MEGDAGNGVEYWLSIDQKFEEVLFKLRDWSHLKIAREDAFTWIKGFSASEVNSVQVLSLPSASRYYIKEAKLIPCGQRLPDRVAPSLLWTPIQRGLKVSLPSQNFNYFGISQTHEITVIPSDQEVAVVATVLDLNSLAEYVSNAPSVRLENLNWTVLDSQKAIVIGRPILPIMGDDYYQNDNFLIPVGWKFKHENMTRLYGQALAEGLHFWYLISNENKLYKIKKSNFNHLNRGAVKSTISALSNVSEPPVI